MIAQNRIAALQEQLTGNKEQIGGFMECVSDLIRANEELRAEITTIRKGEAQNQ